jgi:hypothetical protein
VVVVVVVVLVLVVVVVVVVGQHWSASISNHLPCFGKFLRKIKEPGITKPCLSRRTNALNLFVEFNPLFRIIVNFDCE